MSTSSYSEPVTTSYLIVKQSDLYPASHFRSGLFFCALTLMAVYFLPFNWEDPIWLLYIEVAAFFIGYLLGYTKRFKKLFTFKSEMKEEVHQKALESLNDHGLLGRSRHIFLFASLVERRLECLLSSDLEDQADHHKMLQILGSYKSRMNNANQTGVMEDILRELKDLFPSTQTSTLLNKEIGPKIEAEESPRLEQAPAESMLLADQEEDKKNAPEGSQTGAE